LLLLFEIQSIRLEIIGNL